MAWKQRGGGAASGTQVLAVFVTALALGVVLEPVASLQCLQSGNGTATATSTNCTAGVQYCVSITGNSSSQSCYGYPNVTGLVCPGSGALAGTGRTYSCCNTDNCNAASNTTNTTNATVAAPLAVNNQTDPAAVKFGSNDYIPTVKAGSFGIATYTILCILGAIGFLGGLLTDLAATSRYPFRTE